MSDEADVIATMRTVELADAELNELSQFLFWIEDRKLEGAPWWPGEDQAVRFDEGPLAGAVEKVHDAYRQLTAGPRTVREHGLETVEAGLPERAFERFVEERWAGLSGEARTLAFDAFVEGGGAALKSLADILELEPASSEQRTVARRSAS